MTLVRLMQNAVPRERRASVLAFLALCAGWMLAAVEPCRAQDLEPRAYSSSPIGTNFLAVGYSRASGEVVFDPSTQIEDVNAKINGMTIGYGRTFSFFGRQALITAALPYAWGNLTGTVREQAGEIRRSGLADVKVKLSVNLLNGEALSLKEFVKRPPKTVVGASLTVQAPTGQYDPAKLVNLGNNRWAFKPEVGVSHPIGKWDLDAYGGIWFFTRNNDFYTGGNRRTQSPVVTMQGHASYSFRRGLWAAFDATWYGGGESRVNGGPPSTRFSNVRLGGTLSLPLGGRQSVKILYNDGVTARIGSQFRTFAIAYQVAWFDRQAKP